MSRRLLAVLAACAAALGCLSAAPPTRADEAQDAPVARDDRVVIRGGGTAMADVLANDTDPNGDGLAVCRLEIPRGVPLNQGVSMTIAIGPRDPNDVYLTADRFTPGTYRVTYWACDYDYLTPATITVVVTRTRPVRVRKVGPHVVRFTNPDDRPVRVVLSDRDQSGGILLRPETSRRIRVEGRSVHWYAHARGGRAGSGTVRGLGHR